MEPLTKKIESLLATVFPPPDKIEFRDGDRIIGIVVAKEFRGLGSMDRLERVWKVLDAGLKPKERKRILTMIAVTPEEFALNKAV